MTSLSGRVPGMKQLESLRHGDLVSIVSPAYWLGIRNSTQREHSRDAWLSAFGSVVNAILATDSLQEQTANAPTRSTLHLPIRNVLPFSVPRVGMVRLGFWHILILILSVGIEIFVGTAISPAYSIIAQRCGFPTFHGPMDLISPLGKRSRASTIFFGFWPVTWSMFATIPTRRLRIESGEACDSIWVVFIPNRGNDRNSISCDLTAKFCFSRRSMKRYTVLIARSIICSDWFTSRSKRGVDR